MRLCGSSSASRRKNKVKVVISTSHSRINANPNLNVPNHYEPKKQTLTLTLTIMSNGVPAECDRMYQALLQCHNRIPSGPSRQSACRHLNRSLAECMIAFICPDESSAVKTLCANQGTALKRSQCQQAQISLATCISYHQDPS
ncbi:hypothetical protein QVD17_18971 [Tagetes erecta]|uniref:COX assembly mitochondrial protein n=1 Tax=Tagetes erecta TaxID=13708 RepID=A0AAD8NWW4_TARER|nr:hypothetical protein QVD17_18971 [Tagetes erecta]